MHFGPAELAALGSGVSHSSLDALTNEVAFKLPHGSDDLKHEPAGWSAEVEAIAEGHERNTQRLQVRQTQNQVLETAPEAVQLPDKHSIGRSLKHLVLSLADLESLG